MYMMHERDEHVYTFNDMYTKPLFSCLIWYYIGYMGFKKIELQVKPNEIDVMFKTFVGN